MIDFDADGSVALITMNRPEARNAVNGAIVLRSRTKPLIAAIDGPALAKSR